MEHVNITTILIILLVILVFILPLVLSLFFRVVVPTNMVHIVQSNKKQLLMVRAKNLVTFITNGQVGFLLSVLLELFFQ